MSIAPARAQPAAFEPPRTLMALLQNMKRAAEERRLLDEAFYAETNLKNAFAATHVAYGNQVAGFRLYGTVAGFGVLSDGVRLGGSVRENMQLDFTLSAPENAAPEGNLRLSFVIPKRSFDDIESVFGKEWKNAAYTPRANDPEPYALRHHGKSAISYTLGGGLPGGWMNFAFDARAMLELFTVANH
jgi:hypothetical protein